MTIMNIHLISTVGCPLLEKLEITTNKTKYVPIYKLLMYIICTNCLLKPTHEFPPPTISTFSLFI